VRQTQDVLEIQFFGYVTGATADRALADARERLAGGRPSYFLIDTIDVTGYSPDVRTPGVALLRALKSASLVAGFCIATSSPIRMIGAAVAFVAATPVTFVDSRRAALAQIERERTGVSRSLCG